MFAMTIELGAKRLFKPRVFLSEKPCNVFSESLTEGLAYPLG